MAAPRASLSVRDGIALTVGMVVGIGAFKAPSLVAGSVGDGAVILALWAAGAAIMLIGALCYAELASRYPDAGGEYHFLLRAYGPGLAFLFAWARLAVIQTGAIATVAFVFGDYAQRLLGLGAYGPSLYAVIVVIALAALNVRGTHLSARVQDGLAVVLVSAVTVAAVTGFVLAPDLPAPDLSAQAAMPSRGGVVAGIGFAMIFVMLTYGGWNEAAYFSAELRDVRTGMIRVAVIATVVVAVLYLALNAAYLRVLGPAAMGRSDAVGADYMAALLGRPGAVALTVLILIAAATTMNATIFTGARSAYALGRDTPLLGALGRWDAGAQGPVVAHLVQAALALALIGLGTATRKGFTTMVDYTAPVFWFFLLLTGISLFVLRARDRAPDPATAPSGTQGAFRVPFYPATPLAFCAASAFMLHAALAYSGIGALVGIAAVALGLPVWWLARHASRHASRAPRPAE